MGYFSIKSLDESVLFFHFQVFINISYFLAINIMEKITDFIIIMIFIHTCSLLNSISFQSPSTGEVLAAGENFIVQMATLFKPSVSTG